MVALAVLSVRTTSGAAALPAGFTEDLIDNGLSDPTTMALAPDGRIFVAEQAGRLRVIENVRLLAWPCTSRNHASTGA
jgi:glucose/arabinose dehydrogenase